MNDAEATYLLAGLYWGFMAILIATQAGTAWWGRRQIQGLKRQVEFLQGNLAYVQAHLFGDPSPRQLILTPTATGFAIERQSPAPSSPVSHDV